MTLVEILLSILASTLGIVATILGWKNHKEIAKIEANLNMQVTNKQTIKRGDGNVQQNGVSNMADIEDKKHDR